jgi:hypothetical protein
MVQQQSYATVPLHTIDTDTHGTINSSTMLMLSASSLLSPNWETTKSEIPVLMNNGGNNLASNLCMLQEAIKIRVWATYDITSTQHRLALSKTANNNIQTIILISNQAMSEDEYLGIYMAIL